MRINKITKIRKSLFGKVAKMFGIFVLLSTLALIQSCDFNDDKKPDTVKIDKEKVKKIIEETNRRNVAIEDRQIDDYLRRRNWKFNRTKSGLRYLIYSRGNGVNPLPGDVVYLEYELTLIRGDKVYDSKTDGPLTFTVDHDDVPSGLHEFVKLMKVGDKAKLIVPSYLGYGTVGDEKSVPPRATLIYDLRLMRVSRR